MNTPDFQNAPPEPPAPGIFATTRWTTVLRARDTSDAAGHAALEQLCRAYWRPLRAFAVRAGHSLEDAEDLTQDFFLRLLARNGLLHVSPDKGRFRNFLLVSFRNYLADQRDRSLAAKRGGGQKLWRLDGADATAAQPDDADTVIEPSHSETPEQAFERQWTHTLLQRAQRRLRTEYDATGRSAIYQALGPDAAEAPAERPDDPSGESQEKIAQRLGMTVSAVKAAAFRLRVRYRELIRAEVAETVDTAQEIDHELRHMLRILAG